MKSNYKIIDTNNLEEQALKTAYIIYVDKATERGKLPNSSVYLDNIVCTMLGLSVSRDGSEGRKHSIKSILRSIYCRPISDKEIIDILENRFGKKALNFEKKQHAQKTLNLEYVSIIKEFNDGFLDFLNKATMYKTKASIVKDKDKLLKMNKAFVKPKEDTLLSTFAMSILGDTHGFDNGTPYRTLLISMLKYLYEDDNLSNHNLYQDVVSNNVYTRNIVVGSNNCYDIISLLDVSNTNFVKDSNVYIYENNGILETVRKNSPEQRIISTQGHPNTATKKVIRKLIEQRNKIYYSGDLDPAGIKIADNLLKEFPEIILKDMDLKTYYKYFDKAIISPKEQNIRLINNVNLKKVFDVINQTKKVINQEVIV